MLVHIWGVLMRIQYGISHKHADRCTKIMQFGHKHAHEHITGVGSYTGRAYENPTPLGGRKLCSLVISMHMSILQDVGSYIGACL